MPETPAIVVGPCCGQTPPPFKMCHALNGSGPGRWIINPMFISPRPRRARAFPCSTTACKDAAGTPRPCRDGATVLPDRQDGPPG